MSKFFAVTHWIQEAMFNGLQGPHRFAQLMTIEEIKPIALKLGHLIRTSRHQQGWPLNFVSILDFCTKKPLLSKIKFLHSVECAYITKFNFHTVPAQSCGSPDSQKLFGC